MDKCFNTAGVCYPDEHYMVDMENRLQEITRLIDRGEYFTINRGRQYGKTTVISLLTERLWEKYVVFSISFEGMEDEAYLSSVSFCQRLCRLLFKSVLYRKENGIPETEHLYNSPWNIAADFTVDMSFSPADIAGMLETYEQDHRTGMDIPLIAEMLYDYTSGYPFLISRLCKIMDESLPGKEGFAAKAAA